MWVHSSFVMLFCSVLVFDVTAKRKTYISLCFLSRNRNIWTRSIRLCCNERCKPSDCVATASDTFLTWKIEILLFTFIVCFSFPTHSSSRFDVYLLYVLIEEIKQSLYMSFEKHLCSDIEIKMYFLFSQKCLSFECLSSRQRKQKNNLSFYCRRRHSVQLFEPAAADQLIGLHFKL